jgi:imidazolonepropionase-like amidohydrolase
MRFVILLAMVAALSQAAEQAPQVVAIRAGRLFDPKLDHLLTNQVIIIKSDQVTEVGPVDSIAIPSDAKVIDLGRATVLPGLIDAHVHITDTAVGPLHQELVAWNGAMRSLNAGFTTLVVMGSYGYTDVELRNAIDSDLVPGPRILACGPFLSPTGPGTKVAPLDSQPFFAPMFVFADGTEALRAAVRQISFFGADHIKIYTTLSWESGRTDLFGFKPNGEMVNQALGDLDEIKAIVDEAHRRGLWVASHTYGGDGLKWAVEAGVDAIQHAIAVDDEDIRMLVQKNLPITSTILDQRQEEPFDLEHWAPFSRWRLMEQSWKKMLAAHITLGFGSGAAPPPGRVYNKACNCSHGVQAEMFPIFVKWGRPLCMYCAWQPPSMPQSFTSRLAWDPLRRASMRTLLRSLEIRSRTLPRCNGSNL